jgi:CRP-like cAMP-binding protein
MAPCPPPAARRALDLLRHQAIFRDLSAEELARLARGSSHAHVERGAVIFERGAECTGFHIVVYGQVKLALPRPEGGEKVVEVLGPGRSFGEAMMFAGAPYGVTATALDDTLLLHVARESIEAVLREDPGLARRMIGSLARRVHMLMKEVEALTLHSATQRVSAYLAGLERAGDARVRLPAPKSVLASRLGVAPEYFSRILHELAVEGVIRVEGRDIVLLDAARLAAMGP